MKRWIFSIGLVLLSVLAIGQSRFHFPNSAHLSAGGGEPGGGSTLTTGLNAYWDFEEASSPLVDEVASQNATEQSTAAAYQQTGAEGYAVEFSYLPTYGNGTRFDVVDDIFMDGDITVSCWINCPVDQGDAYYIVTNHDGTDYGWRMWIGISTLEADVYDGSANSAALNGGSISADTWYHAVLTTEGDSAKIYLNGTKTDSEYFPYSVGYGTGSSLTIGAKDDNSGSYDGLLDNLAIYNRAMTQDGVDSLYNSGTPPTYPFE